MKPQRGITLIELLIAMVLGLFVTMAMTQLFIATKTTYMLQQGNSRIQEGGRFGTDMLLRDVRLAGYVGCSGGELVTPKIPSAAVPEMLKHFVSEGLVIFGIDNADGSETDVTGTDYGETAGTDILSVQAISEKGVGLIANMIPVNGAIEISGKGPGFAADDQLLITNCSSADLIVAGAAVVNGDGNTEITHADNLSIVYGPGAIVIEPTVYSYFVKDTGRKDSSGNAINALYRRDAVGTDVEMLEGVTDMQLEFGIDENADRVIDKYYGDASAAEDSTYKIQSFDWDEDNNNWDRVVSMTVTLSIRSVDYAQEALVKVYSATATIRNRAM